MKLRLIATVAALLILISSAASAQGPAEPAQTEPAQASTQPQTDSGVARISLIHGNVSTQRGDSGDWAAATLNQPIVAGDRLSTGDSSRAEVQLDYANILRVDQSSQANITGLTRTQIQIQLARGLANYSVVKDSEADVEIDAPNLSVHPRRGDGSYRITVISDDQAEVMVRRGEADISTPQGSTHLRNGQLITVRGTGNDTKYQIADAPGRDDFDRWNSDRDNTIRNAQAWTRTNRYYVGSEDLDAYGHWTSVPDYGDVWVPAVDYGWAPYRAGRWVWEPYWGWTWVSYEPWGWAPYHYGRWFLYGSSWAWWPGPVYGYRHYRPIWAPAYVSFFGFGRGGFGFGFGGGWGSIGWLPIGPCDRFYPWWGGYRSRFNVVNIYNAHNVYNVHNGGIPPLRSGNRYSNLRLAGQNDRIRQAVSTVPSGNFGRGRFTAQPVSREMFRDGKLVAGNLPVVPNRESVLAGERRAAPPTVGRGAQPERFFTNRAVAKPQSFDREAAQVHNAIQRDGHFTPIVSNQRSAGGEVNSRSLTQGRNTESPGTMRPSAGRPVNGSNQGSNQVSNQNWRRIGPPAQSSPSGARTGLSSSGQRGQTSGNTADWRRPSTYIPQGSASSSSRNSNPAARGNAPVDRRGPSSAPQGSGNQDWRRVDRSAQSGPRSTSGPAEAPASRDRFQREDPTPTQGRGNDWRRMTPARPTASEPTSSRDSGNWRQSVPRDSGRGYSRPPLDMRQPIVTPRSSGPSSYGGYRGSSGSGSYGGYRGNSGGGGVRSVPSGGGGHSAPSGGGGHSAPSHGGGGQHSSGGSGPHRGR
jgi:hypothetical protein